MVPGEDTFYTKLLECMAWMKETMERRAEKDLYPSCAVDVSLKPED